MFLKRKYKYFCALGLISIVLPLVLFGRSNKAKETIETIQWDGDCVTLDDFKLIEIDSAECESFPNISETMKNPTRMRLINDSIIFYCENKEFNLLRIANLNTQEVTELLPVMVDGERSLFSTISQIMLADDKIWLADWKDSRVGALNNDYSVGFDSMELWVIPDGFHKIVPQKRKNFAYMPRSKENVRVELLDESNKTSVLSKKFPPVKSKGSMYNLEVQGEMDIAPDMSYFILSTFGWDFIELYRDGDVKMIRGPFFNETRFVPQKNAKPYMMANEKKSLSCLRVMDNCFAVGVADERLDATRRTILPEIKTILLFSKDGQPLYRLALPNVVDEFDIDYKNNELITLEDYFNPKLKRYKINVPIDLKQ